MSEFLFKYIVTAKLNGSNFGKYVENIGGTSSSPHQFNCSYSFQDLICESSISSSWLLFQNLIGAEFHCICIYLGMILYEDYVLLEQLLLFFFFF